MLLGIMADSHDNLPAIQCAVELFNARAVGFVIHAGDFVSPFSLRAMEELRCPWIGIFGNNDGEKKGLTEQSRGRIQPAPYELNLDKKKVVVFHDLGSKDPMEFLQQGARVVVFGHTHRVEVRKPDQKNLIINPGELGGWLYGKHTVALVDMKKLDARVEEIELRKKPAKLQRRRSKK